MTASNPKGTQARTAIKVQGSGWSEQEDLLAEEAPLEIQLGYGPAGERSSFSLAITMRTPGQDTDLAYGFLFTEGIIGRASDVQSVQRVSSDEHRLRLELSPEVVLDVEQLSRHFYTSSSCGVCGKASIEALKSVSLHYPRSGWPQLSAAQLLAFPEKLAAQQPLFEQTGGIHAAAAFDEQGQLCGLREDVGRHNAMDKLIGACLQSGTFPLRDRALMVSGRLSFELVQKAAMAGVPIIVAVSAPSSLAVELAEEYGMTLIGFLRGQRFNIYCGAERINNLSFL